MKAIGIKGLGALQALRKSKLACIGIAIILFWAALGIIALFFNLPDPLEVNMAQRLQPPSLSHLMGTDNFGRDILSRVISGAKISLGLGVAAVAISLLGGVLIGSISGFFGGKAGDILMRLMDVLQAFPTLVLVISISLALGRNTTSAMVAIGITGMPQFARQMYAQASLLAKSQIVESGRALGLKNSQILLRHVVPNCLSVIVVRAAFSLGSSILTLASLSFLGIGVSPPTPEWGSMISDARGYIISGEWWLFTFPGLAIASLILAFNLLGDGLRDLLDPRT